MNYAIVRLSDSNDHTKYFDLKFKLVQNSFVKKWIACVLEAQQKQYPISEPWAIYNLTDNMNGEFIKDNLNRLMKEVDKVEKLFDIELSDINDQDALNKIHSIFEKHHGKLDEWKMNPLFKNKPSSFRKNLSEINQFVHACENQNGSPKIRIVWFDLPKTKVFTKDDYKLFTNKVTFGSMYHLYADVGKNIESLSEDNDQHHHDFVPNLHYSADCVIYFRDLENEQVQKIESVHKQYVKSNHNYLKDKGYEPDDMRLTTGRIEVAKLESNLSKEQLLNEIIKFDRIQSFNLI